jgi:signal transduction histidine kinase
LNENVRAVQSTPLVDRTGKVLGMISTHFGRFHRPSENELRFLDILARQAADWLERSHADQAVRDAKEQLATANQELDRKVQERTSSLNATLQSLETLLYSIAHDLRAPNRAMQGYAHLLIESHANGLNDKAKFFLHRIAEAALKNEAMIRDLLEYGRLAHAELHCAPLDPALNIHAVLQGFELEIAEKGARVKVAGQWPKVSANDSALTHVLANLVSNALKYVPPGVRPQIEIFPASVNGSTHESNGWVRLCIRDNGIGVPAEQKESIFDLFQRASNASAEGTGMGLAIVRKAAERMGGQAGVDSTLGKGSTFWVALKKASP